MCAVLSGMPTHSSAIPLSLSVLSAERTATSVFWTALCFLLHVARLEVEEKVCLHSPVDRGGNGNTPCVRPVKRQFPRDTPLSSTALCYAFIIGHTNTQSHFQQIHTAIQLCSVDPNLLDLFVKLPLSQALTPQFL